MNDSFFTLPQSKQDNILNAAYRVFSQYEYKKAPMSEIASAGGISKSLLFYYFRNKKELYFYLWTIAIRETKKSVAAFHVTETTDFFEMLERSLLAKCFLYRTYPYLSAFSVKAYYEKEPEIREGIRSDFQAEENKSAKLVFSQINREAFRSDVDLQLMYQEMIWASDGYLHQMAESGCLDADRMERDFRKLIAQWKKVYLK